MADDGSDPEAVAVNDERQQVESLQSEYFRKHEQLERLRQRSRALDDELQLREAELQAIKRKLEVEHHNAKRGATEDKARAESAEDDYLQLQVQRLLQERVPIMSTLLEEAGEEADISKEQAPKQGDTGGKEQEKVHDTVLVSYVQSRETWESRQEDYKVSYRIDGNTTVEQLHRDACAYWGCSRRDYKLWKVNQLNNEIRCLSDDPSKRSKRLQDSSVLNAKEQAHLHLCNHQRRLEEAHAARQREREREIKQMQANAGANPNEQKPLDMLMTLRYGLGLAVAERQAEEFVEAFAPWPGLQHLLRSRDRDRKHKWRYTHFSDIFCFALLAFFTALCFAYRSSSDFFLVRNNVVRALNEGSPGESSQRSAQPFLLYGWPAQPWVDATPGAVWEDGSLRFDDSGPQSVRSVWPLPDFTWGVELTANLEPMFNCSQHSVRLAAMGDGAPALHVSWDCGHVWLFAPNASNTTKACALAESYVLHLVMNLDGHVQFRAGDCEAELTRVSWGVLGVAPLYLTLGADSENASSVAFEMLHLTVTRPAPVRSFKDIRLHSHIQHWLGGSFHFQVFDERSTLRQHYTPVGILRLRQMRARRRACERDLEHAHALIRTCSYVHAETWTELKEPLSSDDRETVEALANLSAPPLQGTPTRWTDEPEGQSSISGQLQATYNGGGYSLDVPLKDLEASGERFLAVLDVLCNTWLSVDTRLLALELILENKAISGHAVASFFLELGPSGAVKPGYEVMPIHIRATVDDETAQVLDVLRWALVIGYLLVGHMYNETQTNLEQGRSFMAYLLSMGGILDFACASVFFAAQAFLFRRRPPDPEQITEFQSYTRFAVNVDTLVVLEGTLFLLLLLRYATFFRFSPEIYRFFQAFIHSLRMFAYFSTVVGPIFFGALFLSSCIYSARALQFSTWTDASSALVLGLRESFHLEAMAAHGPAWTIIFALYFTLTLVVFLMSGFLAIVIHAHFEVELVDKPEANEERWTKERWVQWLLWTRLYERLRGSLEDQAGEAEGEEEDASSSSDEEPAREKTR